jgi:hypothetical protein
MLVIPPLLHQIPLTPAWIFVDVMQFLFYEFICKTLLSKEGSNTS